MIVALKAVQNGICFKDYVRSYFLLHIPLGVWFHLCISNPKYHHCESLKLDLIA